MAKTMSELLDANATRLAEFIEQHLPLFVLTGAGCSTASGIPAYRDEEGNWKHQKPIQYQDFRENAYVRKRYWARSLSGWPLIADAKPAMCHLALSKMERAGMIQYLVTQNVDGLHQKAGSHSVVDLHGNLQTVTCLSCAHQLSRKILQELLLSQNPQFIHQPAKIAADGDASLEAIELSTFCLIACPQCGGVLKPDVVFYGESVPREKVDFAMKQLHASKAMLVLGSSLMVYSAFRFCRVAKSAELDMCSLNIGRTRADADWTVKIEADCNSTLDKAIKKLGLHD